MAAEAAEASVRRTHVSFQRLLASCEKLVATEPSAQSAPALLGVTHDGLIRKLSTYLPVLQEQLETLRKATNVAAGGTEGITAGAVRAYAGKVADLKAVLAATMQTMPQPVIQQDLALKTAVAAAERQQLFRKPAATEPPVHSGSDGTATQPAGNRTVPLVRTRDHIDDDEVLGAGDPATPPAARTRRSRPRSPLAAPLSPAELLFSTDGVRERKHETTKRDEEEMLMQERATQDEIEASLMPITRSFLQSARAINKKLEEDNRRLDSATTHMENNVEQITAATSVLSSQIRGTWSDSCRMCLMLLLVAIVFVAVVVVIRITPTPPSSR